MKIGLSANALYPSVGGLSLLHETFNRKKASEYLSKLRTHSVEYQAEFPLNEDDEYGIVTDIDRRTGHKIAFSLDEKPLLNIEMQERMGLNLAHPLLKTLGILQKIEPIPKELTRKATLDKDWLWVNGGFQIEDNFVIKDRFSDSDDSRNATARVLKTYPEFKPTIEKFLKILSGALEVDFSLVHASRRIPSEKDLLFFSDAGEYEFSMQMQMQKFPIPDVGDSNFKSLAESLVAPTTTNYSSWDSSYDERDTSDLGELVNRTLSEHLFIERGYRIAADYRLLLDRHQYDALESFESSLTPGNYPLLIRLFLVDSQGREFSFSEVGSGLGYVLPVLVSLFGKKKVSIIQQPELHLHPALQAAIGDVLIEACNRGKQVIVETHSEHILLRVLKRIRQTSTGHPLADELRLSPEDVSVLYFDPSPDGTTIVKRLRVSPDGDFLDQWPRGFFPERDQELFDE